MINFLNLQSLYKQQMDMLLAKTGLTTKCLLNYGITKKDICPNCVYDANLKKSANKYKTGGPNPFVDGRICPYCNGVGYHGLVKVEEAYLAIIWDYKNWVIKPINIQNPTGMIQTICDRSLLDKLKKCKDLTVIYTSANSNPLFKLAEEPNPAGLGDNNYLICNWEKIGISSITESMVEKPIIGYNTVNYSGPLGNIMFNVGSNGGPSAYGTYDQNGNAEEWTGTRQGNNSPIQIKVAGGYAGSSASSLLKGGIYGTSESGVRYRGFRIVTIEKNHQNFPDNPDDINDFVLVDDKYNLPDSNGYGSVNYDYYIGKHEITYDKWCDFINAVASYTTTSTLLTSIDRNVPAAGTLWGNPEITSDTYGLLNNSFLTRVSYVAPTGLPGNYVFTVLDEYKNKPVTNIDWLDAARYCNWLSNGSPSGYQTVNNDGSTPNSNTTENGSYNLNGVTLLSSFINHSSTAKYRLPTIDEWYKAAFYKKNTAEYWNYATQSDLIPEVVNNINVNDIAMILTYDTTLDSGNNIVLPLSNPVDIVVDWGDGNIEFFDEDGQKEHVYASEGEYTVKLLGNLHYLNNKLAFTRNGTVNSHQSKLKSCESFGQTHLKSLEKFFYGCIYLDEVPSYLPSGVTNLTDTFAYAVNFDGTGVINWDTSNVSISAGTFLSSSNFNQDISSWDTSNIVNMNLMFYAAYDFNQDLSTWCVTNIPTEPTLFYDLATNWVLSRPIWGSCPS